MESVGSVGSLPAGRQGTGSEGVGRPRQRLRPSGGYRDLRSFQVATVIYDATASFCERFIDKRSRTRDQMIRAARSGRQNIAEGSRAGATSSRTELRLVNVARASLDELLLDYEDYLRQNGHPQWTKDSPEAEAVRKVGRERAKRNDPSDRDDPSAEYRPWIKHDDPAVVANAVICLIHQANYLLDRQVRGLEKQFVKVGGCSEQLAAARLKERAKHSRSDQSDPCLPAGQGTDQGINPPACPLCGGLMALRISKKGPRPGTQFWGCAKYPECRGTKSL